jgi:hypothetical protein
MQLINHFKTVLENMTNLEILILIIQCLFILTLSYQVYRMVYLRYYKSFKKEIIKLMESKGLKIVELVRPDSDELKRNPFEFKDSFIMRMISKRALFSDLFYWKKPDYRIAIGVSEDSTEYRIWIEINTIYFKKSEINYIKQKIKRGSTTTKENDNFWSCPACGFKNRNMNTICHDCGIHFV